MNKQCNALDVGCLGKHVEGNAPFHPEMVSGKETEITGKRSGIARHIDNCPGPETVKLIHELSGTGPGGIEDNDVKLLPSVGQVRHVFKCISADEGNVRPYNGRTGIAPGIVD
jgi:hypothetical protein